MMSYPRRDVVGTPRNFLYDWLRRGLDLLFPPRCPACSRAGTWFCDSCLASVEPIPRPICPRCGRPHANDGLCRHCRAKPVQLDGIRSVALHDGALRKAIHHFKYRRQRELATPLGEMLFSYWRDMNLVPDVVIPVPLHVDRQKERGFNQAGLLAYVLATRAQLPLNDVDLVRTRAAAPQVGLGMAQRRANVQDAFVWTGDGLDGACVLLIDDVCTTGATLEASAQALREGGADVVWALTLARPLDSFEENVVSEGNLQHS